ncbi:hypothetical protein [Aureivirga sp. CE67]|uniref:hypothetical protein n=1 Tax=Aureivirga sp. CE67 TaxID=1788983 RepID=UPI0018C909B6|nr:hypothetical protein [Aureivirga sp. CE67]
MKKQTYLLFILVFFLINTGIYACTCIGKRTFKKEIKNSDAVLVGKIISKELITLVDSTAIKMFANDNIIAKGPLYETVIAKYELLLTSKYKGNTTTDTIVIYTGLGNGDCGVHFKIGRNYVVYSKSETYFGQKYNDWPFPKGKNIYWTNTCSRATLEIEKEIQEIEKHRKKQ